MPKSVFTDAYATLLDTLVALRKEKGVTQVDLAERLGRTQQFVSFVERGVRRVDVIEFYAIVRALGGDPEAVFSQLVRKLPRVVRI